MPSTVRQQASFDARCLTLVVLGATVACSDKSTPPEPPPRPSVASIVVTPSAPSIVVGDSVRIVAVLKSAAGAVLTDRTQQWTSSEPTTATVSTTGMVIGVAPGGPVSIIVTSEGIAATAQVTVTRPPVASIDLTPVDTTIETGKTVQLVATLRSGAGEVLTDRDLAWTSSMPAIATVSEEGLVTAVAAGGPVTISVASEGVVATAQLRVTAPVSNSLLYRWTFSEDGGPGTSFRDDIRGARASLVRVGPLAGSAIGGQVTLTGGARNSADYLALPPGLLRGQTDATIEVWATLHSLKSWSRVFDVGSGTANNLFIAWSQGTISSTDRTGFAVNGVENRADNRLAPFTIDLQHHVVLTIDEGGGDGGKTRLSLYLDGVPRGSFDTAYRLRDLIDDDFWLGRSHYGDETANASYNEVRIHGAALAAAQVQQSFVNGPIGSQQPTAWEIIPPTGMGDDKVRGVGVRFQLRAVGRDALGRQFPITSARWMSENPSVATVESTGLVHTVAAGRAEISAAVAGTTTRWSAQVVDMEIATIPSFLGTPAQGALWEVPVVIIRHLPTSDGVTLDIANAGISGSLADVTKRVELFEQRIKFMLEEGSRFRGYKAPTAPPSLGYRVLHIVTIYEGFRKGREVPWNPGHFFPDYQSILNRVDARTWVNTRGVKEFWVWGYHNDEFEQPESNMSSPVTGDISNSSRFPDDLPVFNNTYIVYGYNYGRTQAEAVHNHGHQLEAMMSYVAFRQDGNDRLFWRDFVGFATPTQFVPGRAGSTHFPPNARQDYDYLNPAPVASDIEDWRPDNTGQKTSVNVDTWGKLTYQWPGEPDFPQRVESQWYMYWFQNFPGRGNRIPHGTRWMTNWWAFVGDWDAAIKSGLGLYADAVAANVGSTNSLRSR